MRKFWRLLKHNCSWYFKILGYVPILRISMRKNLNKWRLRNRNKNRRREIRSLLLIAWEKNRKYCRGENSICYKRHQVHNRSPNMLIFTATWSNRQIIVHKTWSLWTQLIFSATMVYQSHKTSQNNRKLNNHKLNPRRGYKNKEIRRKRKNIAEVKVRESQQSKDDI